ncbi:MAG: response regulator [Myxococcaceae bacterium]|nr:response regulator [Myxococcaceae bacterium]
MTVGGPAESGDGRFRAMFERSADAILLLDTRSNTFVEYNDTTLDMLRCTRAELATLHPSALSPASQPDGRDSFEKANEMIAIAVHEGSHRFEWVHCSPHRAPFPVEVLLTPLSDEERPLVLVVWRDITERKQAERALVEAQKLESLGVLASGIAHDFNNLLMAVVGHLELTRLSLSPDSTVAKEHLETIFQAVHRAADLTRQLLAYSGRGRFLVEPVDLGRALGDAGELLRVSISKRVRLVMEPGPEGLIIEADRGQLQQVLMNLLSNASEAIEGEGVVTIRTRREVLDTHALSARFPGQALAPGDYVVLAVSDTGRGMSPEVLARVFDPFFSTKGRGRGLGLSAVRGIVAQLRAGLRVMSAVGGGTTFEVAFPASQHPAPARPEAPPVQRATSSVVLLVDDDPSVRTSIAALLKALGFAVVEASDGPSAIEAWRQSSDRISWVLMDLTMPGADGYETFLQLRELDPRVKVVLSSGWAEEDVSARFAERPPSAFLPKPFTVADLERVLARIGA